MLGTLAKAGGRKFGCVDCDAKAQLRLAE